MGRTSRVTCYTCRTGSAQSERPSKEQTLSDLVFFLLFAVAVCAVFVVAGGLVALVERRWPWFIAAIDAVLAGRPMPPDEKPRPRAVPHTPRHVRGR